MKLITMLSGLAVGILLAYLAYSASQSGSSTASSSTPRSASFEPSARTTEGNDPSNPSNPSAFNHIASSALHYDSVTMKTTFGDDSSLPWDSVVRVDSIKTNETFASQLCSSIATNIIIRAISPTTSKFLMPHCLSSHKVLRFSVEDASIIIDDFSVFPTSLLDLSAESSALAPRDSNSLGFDAHGNIDWEAIFNHLPKLNRLELSNSNVSGYAPSKITHNIDAFYCSSCGLVGTISASLFSNMSIYAGARLDLSDNKLHGTIPAGLFDPIGRQRNYGSFISFAGNQLTGTLPPSLVLPFADASIHGVTLNFQSNGFTGSVPAVPTMNGGRLTLNFSNNAFTGKLPDLIDFNPQAELSIDARSNLLDEGVPHAFLSSKEVMDHFREELKMSRSESR